MTSLSSLFDSVLILSPFRWHDVWQTSHHVAHHLSCSIPVFYKEPGPLWHPKTTQFSARHCIAATLRTRRRIADQLYTISPRTLPLGTLPVVSAANQRFSLRATARVLSEARARRPLHWLYFYPGCSRDVIGTEYLYHCIDLVEDDEELDIIKRARLILAVSSPLYDRCVALNPNTHLLPNGVEYEWYSGFSGSLPADLPSKRPRIICTGTISPNTNLRLLARVADHIPSASLVMVGPLWTTVSPELKELQQKPNVYFLGARRPSELPGYIAACDVGLMPYSALRRIGYLDPIRLMQYFAMGKPVVTVDIPAVDAYREICYVAPDETAFPSLVSSALAEQLDDPRRDHRRSAAKCRDWRHIVARGSELVARHWIPAA